MSDLALEAGWYADPYGEKLERYHDGGRWTGRLRVPGSDTEMVQPDAATPIRPGMRGMVTALACVIVFGLYVVAVVESFTLSALAGALLVLGYTVVWAVLVIVFAPKVEGSLWWAVAPLIPIVGGFIALYATIMIVNRLAYLPYRDWQMNDIDLNEWQQVSHPTKPGETLYTRRRTRLGATG